MADHDAHGPAVALITRVLARARDDNADDDWTARSILAEVLVDHGQRRGGGGGGAEDLYQRRGSGSGFHGGMCGGRRDVHRIPGGNDG